MGTPVKTVQRCCSIVSSTVSVLKRGMRDHCSAETYGSIQNSRQPEDVEHREDGEANVVVAESRTGHPRTCAVHVQLEVGELGALGSTGGTTRVEKNSCVVGAGRFYLAGVLGEVELVEVVRAFGTIVPTGHFHHVRRDPPDLGHGLHGLRGERHECDQDLRVGTPR